MDFPEIGSANTETESTWAESVCVELACTGFELNGLGWEGGWELDWAVETIG